MNDKYMRMKTMTTYRNSVNTDNDDSGYIRLYYDGKTSVWKASGASAGRLARLVPELGPKGWLRAFFTSEISLDEWQLEQYGLAELVVLVTDSLLVLCAERP